MFYGYGYTLHSLGGLVPPVNTIAPTITGTAEVGQTLTCSQGTWSGSPTSYAYQWKRGGVNIGGATNSTYVLVAADEGESIKCTVTATNGAGSASADSNTVTPTWEADAQAFVTAASITDQVEAEAVNQLVIDLKAASLWTKMKAVYPMVGGTAATHKWNLKDPRDLDAAYRLSFAGGWTHNSNGITGNSTNTFADTFAVPNTIFSDANSTHLSMYVRNNSAASNYVDFGSGDAGSLSTAINSAYANSAISYMHDVTGVSAANTDSRGFYCGTRTASNVHKLFKNNGQLGSTDTTTVGTLQSYKIYLGAYNVAGTASYVSDRNYAFASIGDGLSDTEAANLYTAVQTFQTSLSRNV